MDGHGHVPATEADDAGTLGVAFTASALPQWVFQRKTLRILAVNDAAVAQYGYPRDKFLGMTILQLHPVEEEDAVRSIASEPLNATPAVHPRLWRHVTATGERLVRMALSDVTVGGAAARLVQTLDVAADHELKVDYQTAVAREAEARAHVESVSRSKDALLATVGHELRQPLAPLLAAIAVMEQRVSRDVGVRAREVIKRQVGVLNRLVEDLLDAARVQQGKVKLRRETTDLRTLVAEIVAAHFPELATHGLVLDTNLPSTPVWVSIDGTRFHQILSNLLANAVRHSDSGGRVRVRVDVADAQASLVVRDEGRGIDANILPHVFDPFAQAEPGANSGLGLGLSVVRALAELHGGHVAAASDGPGRGAEFVVTLPISPLPAIPVKTFASDLRSVAELIRVRAAGESDLLDGALEGIDTALLIADDRSRVLNANHAALVLTGYAEEELAALYVADILAMNGEHANDHWQEFAVDGRQEGILVLLRKDGARLPVRYCAIRDVRPGLHLSALDAI